IIIDMYGSGSKPLINGNGANGPVITLNNQDYWEINNLEITNNSAAEGDRLGVRVGASDGNTHPHIHLKNLEIHDIKGRYTFDMTGKNTGGIGIRITGGGTATRFDDVLIEGCEVYNIVRVGISCASTQASVVGNQPITNMRVRNNVIHHCAGDGMILRLTNGAIVENNLAYENHNANEGLVSYGVALWCRSVDNTVFQYNEVYNTRGALDGQGFDADFDAHGTIFQYNYSHDNEGGFLLVMNGVTKTIVRYNISENDGTKGGHIINFSDYDPGGNPTRGAATFYNNTFYISANSNAAFSDKAMASSAYYNNIIYKLGGGPIQIASAGQVAQWNNNLIYGSASKPADPNLITTDPLLVAPGTGGTGMNTVDGYKLKAGSPALNSGRVIANNGNKDYFGNAVSATTNPHIGAYNGAPIGIVGPTAEFTSDKSIVCSGETVIFTNASTGTISTYSWNFGTGATPATATGAGPHAVTYNTAGSKTVSLIVSGANGNDTETKTNYVIVNALPVTSAIAGKSSVCYNEATTYAVSNTAGSSYAWTVPAGTAITSGAGTNSVSVKFAGTGGNITVRETAASGCAGNAQSLAVNAIDCTPVGNINLAVLKDAYVRDGASAGTAHGVSDVNNLMTKNSGAVDNGFNRETYLAFDLSTVNQNITKAEVKVYCNTPVANTVVNIHAVSNTVWSETTLTWNNKPASGAAISNTTVTTTGYYTFDVTAYVKSEKAAGRNVVSFDLKNVTVTTGNVVWNSKEAAANKPLLSLSTDTTTTPPPPPTPTGCSGSVANGDYSYNASSSGNMVTMKFIPQGPVVGTTLVILTYKINNGGYIGVQMTKDANGNYTRDITAASGSKITFYFTYRIGNTMTERNSSANPHSYVAGTNCNAKLSDELSAPDNSSQEVNSGFGISPNPIQDQLVLSGNFNESGAQITILDILGNVMFHQIDYTKGNSNREINLSMLSPGVYIIKVHTQTATFTSKFLKQ
ncbi:MAG: DNRLRE domain-containing protein, partial [Cytophagaceae bacterium]|nr:DNRLRE domain-containing protein [Cytophagaceae bacterium]